MLVVFCCALSLLLHGAHAKCHMTASLGCFVDNDGPRVLKGYAQLGQEGDGMDLDHCGQLCQDKKFTLAGVEDGHQCFCGDTMTSHKPSTGCTASCPSNSSEKCGGPDAIQVFKFACVGPPSPPLPHAPPPPPPPPPAPSSPNLCPDFSREYCKPSVPLEERIEMVMSYMSIEDKMMTMGEQGITGKYKDGTNLAARSVSWWNEALHGVCRSCGDNGNKCPTQFPEANAMSASFNATLWHMIGDTISTEGRAFYNVGGLNGLSFFAPQLNMASNPLWGRNMECPGEDPHLSSVYAREYIKGFQGYGHPSGLLKAVTTPKHFTGQVFEGDGSDPWGNGTTVNRQSNDTRYTLRDLEQYFLPAFRAAMVDAEAGSVMCAYQGVNGVPMCANGFILNRVVRESWGWKGFVVSDCDAVNTMMVRGEPGGNSAFGHAYSLSGQMAVQDGVRAGCDSNCGGPYHQYGMQAIEQGLVTEKELNASVRRLLRPHFQIGLFDPVEGQPWSKYDWTNVATPQHQQLALEAARQSMVLLQNPSDLLPLKSGGKVLVAGPHFDATQVMLGNYHGSAAPMEPLWTHIVKLNGNSTTNTSDAYKPESNCHDKNTTSIPVVVAAAKEAETVVLVLGGDCHEGEGTDRDFLHLPGAQSELFKAVIATGKQVVVVIINGGPYSIDEIKGTGAAVIQAGFPGQAGGQAIAETLFGVNNPGGKLTTTIYPASYANGEPMAGTPWMDAGLRPRGATNLPASEGRTHMFYTGTPLFAFGFGLSYTNFSIAFDASTSNADVSTVSLSDLTSTFTNVSFGIKVTNTGQRRGKETVMAYWSPPTSVDPDLKQQLFEFQGVVLDPGTSQTLVFNLPEPVGIATVTLDGDRVFHPGDYTVRFSRGHGDELTRVVSAKGSAPVLLKKFPSRWVEGHELTVDACVEGTTDVISHTEQFVVDYKVFVWDSSNGEIKHRASNLCVTPDAEGGFTHLRNCSADSKWKYDSTAKTFKTASGDCLVTSANSTSELRVNVTVAAGGKCDGANAQWSYDSVTGMIQSGLAHSAPPPDTGGHGWRWGASKLCLALRTEGAFNIGA